MWDWLVGMSFVERRRIFSWACFDFANSAFATLILTYVYASYFTSSIAENEVSGTRLWGNAVALSSLMIAFISPVLGAVADAFGWKKRMMTACIGLGVLGTGFLFFPQKGDVAWAFWIFVVANVAVELSIVFNNAFLPEIAPRERHGRVSGQAWALGYVGGLLCLGVALVGFIFPDKPWFGLSTEGGENVRATCLLVAVWLGVFSVPMLLWVKEGKRLRQPDGVLSVAVSAFSRLGETFSHIREYRQLFWLLIARLFYNDGLVGIFAFGGIYATGTFGFSFEQLMYFGIVLNVSSAVGAFGFGFIEDWVGSRMTVIVSTLGLVASSFGALFVSSQEAFWVCAVFIGLLIGPNQSASRAYISRLCPEEKANEFFGFFAFSGRATSFVTPLMFGHLTGWFDSQRVGMAAIPVLLFVGLCVLVFKTETDLPERTTP